MPYPTYRKQLNATVNYYIQDISGNRSMIIELNTSDSFPMSKGTFSGVTQASTGEEFTEVRGEVDEWLRVGTRPPHSPS